MSDSLWKEIEVTALAVLDFVQYGLYQLIRNPMVLISMILLIVVQKNDLEVQVGKMFKAKA